MLKPPIGAVEYAVVISLIVRCSAIEGVEYVTVDLVYVWCFDNISRAPQGCCVQILCHAAELVVERRWRQGDGWLIQSEVRFRAINQLRE